ncbi:hypothetical protein ACTJJM_05545 [Stenotrophomonas sp. 22692]|uniref:hypothetical protein n=1 Tax=Stenotrophomonas sp. 22692 TaxID=3453956 RepID=UPI003F87CE44
MNTNDKTLADVQPGGMVRLGDQAELDRLEFQAWARELLPCPFCGSSAEFVPYKDNGLTLKCKSVGCIQRNQRTLRYGIDWLRTSMAEHWNTRALSAQPSPGSQDALASLPLYRLADDANGNRGLHRDDTGSWVKLQDVERALAARQPVSDQHPDDLAVDAFAAAMKAKMAAARAKGRGGWEDPAQCSADDLSSMLRDHVEKGDPRDVANFCMMLHQRGEAIAARQPVGEPAMYQVRPRLLREGKGWRKVTKREYDDRGPFPGYDEAEWERRTLYAAPAAQAVDLGQFRRPIEEWRSDMQQWVEGHGDYDGVFAKDIAEANRLLALIDSQAVGNG